MEIKNKKYIFVTGGVMSGVGKGTTCSSIAAILKAKGFEVTALKIDPYVNVDAGTMNPTEHGEVFVLDDGMECDQDMGNYERFLEKSLTSANYMTTGSVYKTVIEKERALKYRGKCVEVVPHIPLEVIRRIEKAARKEKAEISVIEIGGTVGEYQNILFLEAARMMKIKYPKDVLVVMVSFLPIPDKIGEMKTKPTQYAVRTLNSAGIQPDFIIARSERSLDQKRKEKIATFCNINEDYVISAPDVDSVYNLPVNFEKDKIGEKILEKLNLEIVENNIKKWEKITEKIKKIKKNLEIAVIGKYFSTGEFVLSDSYISVIEAIKHGAIHNEVKTNLTWIDSIDYEKDPSKVQELKRFDGIVVPGGFGERGVEGIIRAINYARVNKIPYLGLCYGMQLAVIEFARNMAGITRATSKEIKENSKYTVIDIMPDQKKKMEKNDFGGTMRLGSYKALLKKSTIAAKAYNDSLIYERHRHRYEVNPKFIKDLEKAGLVFSGFSPDRRLMEIMELPKAYHPFFLGTQFHPEFKSRPHNPHPLFLEFIKVAKKLKFQAKK
ncbi:MAG: CTP synthase [Candidatus Moranbacteria bacterium]|nr:CTP synthase [Candidatus Moranbacteria bacterium]